MRAHRVRIEHERGRWRLYVLRSRESGPEASWLSLGSCADRDTALRLWTALRLRDKRR